MMITPQQIADLDKILRVAEKDCVKVPTGYAARIIHARFILGLNNNFPDSLQEYQDGLYAPVVTVQSVE